MNKIMNFFTCFSIPVHESPECVKDMIENILYCNEDCCIVIHSNDFLYNIMKTFEKEYNNVFINSIHYNKTLYTKDIFLSHVQNFDYVNSTLSLTFDYFIPLGSNCLFIKNLSRQNIEDRVIKQLSYIFCKHNKSIWHYPEFYLNTKIIEILDRDGIEIIGHQHEGLLITKHGMNLVSQYVSSNNLFSLITKETVFEEILFISLVKHFDKKFNHYSITKVFWDLPNYSPSTSDVIKCMENKENGIYSVKRVNRNYFDFLRTFIRKSLNDYSK